MPKIELKCGEKTCYREWGAPCRALRFERYGSVCTCGIWGKELQDENGVHSGPGWLQRLPECLAAEKE